MFQNCKTNWPMTTSMSGMSGISEQMMKNCPLPGMSWNTIPITSPFLNICHFSPQTRFSKCTMFACSIWYFSSGQNFNLKFLLRTKFLSTNAFCGCCDKNYIRCINLLLSTKVLIIWMNCLHLLLSAKVLTIWMNCSHLLLNAKVLTISMNCLHLLLNAKVLTIWMNCSTLPQLLRSSCWWHWFQQLAQPLKKKSLQKNHCDNSDYDNEDYDEDDSIELNPVSMIAFQLPLQRQRHWQWRGWWQWRL